jgi:hypothetical protein
MVRIARLAPPHYVEMTKGIPLYEKMPFSFR